MIVTIVEKYRLLAERLYTRTLSGDLAWEYDDLLEILSTKVAGRDIFLSSVTNDNGEPAIQVELSNPATNRRERFLDDDINGKWPKIEGYESYWKLLRALYDYGVRLATGADKDVDDILSDLDDDIPF
ncbi:MAG: hypothetical protein K0R64_1108 [Novosphingobium lindaniclasticum]|jgi:hypothetical protein|uniref:hypothetical protein n=1 Tax=Novosphingobium lindaniclasticum TaxID=1329895 RepID=UPI0024098363|nr:hypothetical protein [Novosphingobium lindaniclasticum]MDF2638124.1 hypothetical protein [Novosphingobium lindaniclasticum]